MSKLPFMQFYPSDWLRDTRTLSQRAKGTWIDLLCAAWEAPERGKLQWTWQAFTRFVGLETKPKEAVTLWEELRLSGVGTFDYNKEANLVTIMSRRIIREEHERNQGRERQSRKRHAPVTEESRGIYQKSEVRDQNLKIKNEATPVDNSTGNGKEPAWKSVADRIFNSDKARFLKLIVWLKDAAKAGYSETTIATALMDFEVQDKKHHIDNWWPYLDKVALKAHAKIMQAEGEQYKAGDLTQFGAVLRKIASQ